MREEKLMIRLDENEKRMLDSCASENGLPTSSWARSQLLKAARNGNGLHPSLPLADRGLSILSLFCGPGGLDQGFREAGFQPRLAFDIDRECVGTFAANHPGAQAFVRDIRKLRLDELDSLHGGAFAPVGVIGGPPCQSFSVSNVHQREDDPRHGLAEAYADLLTKLNQRSPVSFFLFENVPGLLGKKHRHRYERFKSLFEAAGFTVCEQILDAKYFGVPQERERIFIVGINTSLHPGKTWTPPSPQREVRTVRDAIGGLPEPVHNRRGLDPESIPVHPNHWCLVPRSRKFKNANLKQGQAIGRSFRTLSWNRPSWTVAYGHREVHVHPEGHRRLSIYEAMLLQTFPSSYRLTGNMTAQIRLVSEAVPVRLALRIAQSIRQSLVI